MINPTEIIYSKEKARKRLGVSRGRYEQFIESGILPKPFVIVNGSRPIHTETQIQIAESNLYQKAVENSRPRTPDVKPIKPISENLKALIANRRK